ncbi:MAG: hypothetical protein GKR89_23775 [Candidatus Latescibacteria bacterium]|nr:hypothetical protein [Candidatus Latescibacterota bacterium]
MADPKHSWRMLVNDDGWIIGTADAPLTPQLLHDRMIGPYANSPVDVFLWSVGGHEVYDYETEVGQRFGQGDQNLDPTQQRRRDNLTALIQQHGGPVTAIAQLCQQAGLAFFPSVRMNEHYDMDEAAPNYGRLRRDHPDWLIGRPGEEMPPGGLEWGIRTGLNYACAPVRDHMAAIIFELIERFDIAGIELDFMRHPAFFRVEEAAAQAYLMNDLVARVRAKLDQVGTARGTHLDLAVRVPPTLADARRIGLDVATWVQNGWIDLLIAGGGFIPFEMPIAEFVELARDSQCRVYGCFEGLRSLLTQNQLRALAARYWAHGVDGLYFFNYYSMSAAWKQQVLGQLADAAGLAQTDLCYVVDRTERERPTSQLGFSFRNAIPRAQLPVLLDKTHTGQAARLQLDIAAVDPGAQCTLGLGFAQLADDTQLRVVLNGRPLAWAQRQKPQQPWTRTEYEPDWNIYPSTTRPVPLEEDPIEFPVPVDWLRTGVNELEVGLVSGAALVLQEVRLHLAATG